MMDTIPDCAMPDDLVLGPAFPRLPTLDCAIIVSEKRRAVVRDLVLPSVLRQSIFHEVLVVGDYEPGPGYRYLPLPPVTKTTLDALMKRETATVASSADAILFLCDDHVLYGDWDHAWRVVNLQPWDVLVPQRILTDGATFRTLNMGLDPRDPHAPYCGGHAGIFRRVVLQRCPWLATPHGLFWDLDHSRLLQQAGFTLREGLGLIVEDVDPNPAERLRHDFPPVAPTHGMV